ncbi:MAG: ParB/RepB/Spo0J family partition protein [Ruminococcaceae bacterium]|nr:ParB/RepB/Spo0J family partition protein [Oscillospiraceae bacterium]
MAIKKSGLGKGLDALFLDNSTTDGDKPLRLPITEIEPNRDQPRKHFDDEALQELCDSIKIHGVIQPLVVRPISDGGYQLIAGERRWRASRMAGLTEVPVVIREMAENETMEIALIENLQREDLNPIEEAEGFRVLMDNYNLTQQEAAERVGKSRPAVANTMRLLALPVKTLDYVKNGKLSAGHARALLPINEEARINLVADEIIRKGLSVRDVEKMVKNILSDKKHKEKDKDKKKEKRDPFYDECELAIREELGRKAEIHLKSANKGTIEIEFFSKYDLQTILEALAGGK